MELVVCCRHSKQDSSVSHYVVLFCIGGLIYLVYTKVLSPSRTPPSAEGDGPASARQRNRLVLRLCSLEPSLQTLPAH